MSIMIRCLFFLLVVTGCSGGEIAPAGGAFYKLYGNGTFQEAVAMGVAPGDDVFMIGSQFVRNQDSAALVLIHTNARGNQLWSARYFGKGYTTAKAIIALPDNEVLVLAASRESDHAEYVPVIYRVNARGELLNEYFIGQEEEAESPTTGSKYPQGMVLGEGGTVYLLSNLKYGSGISGKSFIDKIDLKSGEVLDSRVFTSSEMTEAKQIYLRGDKLLVVGNTLQQTGEAQHQSMFVASFSAHLVEAQHVVVGSLENDDFANAMVNSAGELVIVSSQQNIGSPVARGVLRVLDLRTFRVKNMVNLDYSPNETPEAISEDGEGNYMVALNTVGERGKTNIIIQKLDPAGKALWDLPKEVGGEGSDKIAQVIMKDGYAYLLSTIDMQNENTLISLSRIRF